MITLHPSPFAKEDSLFIRTDVERTNLFWVAPLHPPSSCFLINIKPDILAILFEIIIRSPHARSWEQQQSKSEYNGQITGSGNATTSWPLLWAIKVTSSLMLSSMSSTIILSFILQHHNCWVVTKKERVMWYCSWDFEVNKLAQHQLIKPLQFLHIRASCNPAFRLTSCAQNNVRGIARNSHPLWLQPTTTYDWQRQIYLGPGNIDQWLQAIGKETGGLSSFGLFCKWSFRGPHANRRTNVMDHFQQEGIADIYWARVSLPFSSSMSILSSFFVGDVPIMTSWLECYAILSSIYHWLCYC